MIVMSLTRKARSAWAEWFCARGEDGAPWSTKMSTMVSPYRYDLSARAQACPTVRKPMPGCDAKCDVPALAETGRNLPSVHVGRAVSDRRGLGLSCRYFAPYSAAGLLPKPPRQFLRPLPRLPTLPIPPVQTTTSRGGESRPALRRRHWRRSDPPTLSSARWSRWAAATYNRR